MLIDHRAELCERCGYPLPRNSILSFCIMCWDDDTHRIEDDALEAQRND